MSDRPPASGEPRIKCDGGCGRSIPLKGSVHESEKLAGWVSVGGEDSRGFDGYVGIVCSKECGQATVLRWFEETWEQRP